MSVSGSLPAAPVDAVTAQNPWSGTAWRIALARRVPFLGQLHFDPFAESLASPSDRARKTLARLAAMRAARLRVMAPSTALAVTTRWGIEAGRVWVAPVPLTWPDAAPAPRERLVVGAMRLAADRAPERWIATAAAIAHARPDVRFVLAGDGPRLAALRRAAIGLPIALPGLLAPAALAALFARAALFLHTAPHEAFGRAIAEAQAAGLAVIARATTGAAAILRDATTGVLATSERELVAAAVALLDDPGRAAVMGAAGRRAAEARFVPARMRARVIDFLLGERSMEASGCDTCWC